MITVRAAAVAWRCGALLAQTSVSEGRKASIVAEAFQAYIDMVTGVTKTTQAKASATARTLLKQAGLEDMASEASERVTKLAEEMVNAGRANRELMQRFVTTEVGKAAARLGFARADEVEALRDEVASLRTQLNEATAKAARSAPAKAAPAKKASAKKASAERASAKKATATKTPAKGTPARSAAATMTPTKAAANSPGPKPPHETAATSDGVTAGEQ
jgi:hypothetical protein